MGLMAAAGHNAGSDPHIQKAIEWLIENQGPDGNWEENWFTGTGFPRVFYLKYHLYRLYFPLMALALSPVDGPMIAQRLVGCVLSIRARLDDSISPIETGGFSRRATL